jgi:aryl-alcohol dehydrogenase-like predicted oxidoreductase
MFHRERPEREYAPLYEKYKIGTTTFSSLAGGFLTGKVRFLPLGSTFKLWAFSVRKYNDGIPENSRFKNHPEFYKKTAEELETPEGKAKIQKVRDLTKLAEELQSTPTALALAWVAKNPNTSTVILGASSVEQLKENLKALDVLDKLTPEVLEKIEKILDNKPAAWETYGRPGLFV